MLIWVDLACRKGFFLPEKGAQMLNPFAKWLRRSPSSTTLTRRPSRVRLALEALEDRCTPANFSVANFNDGGGGSLRQAILDANTTAVADTIVFSTNLTGQTITLASALPAITQPLTISGLGADQLTVSGNNAFRPFTTQNATVTIAGLTVANGLSTAGQDGGGILVNGGIVTLDKVVIAQNTSNTNTNGGGVAVTGAGAQLRISNSTIRSNTTPRDGGGLLVGTGAAAVLFNTSISANRVTGFFDGAGIKNFGTLSMTDCTVADNVGAANFFFGAGLSSSGQSTLLRCTFAGNRAGGTAGGIYVRTGTTNLTNCTIVGNSSASIVGGGGIRVDIGAIASISNCTITGNLDLSSSSTSSGGISNNGTTTLVNSIVADNQSVGGAARDLRGTFTASFNLVTFVDANTNVTNGVNNNVVAADPLLGPLQFNGGLTQTRAILPGSPALNTGSNALVPWGVTIDQRFVPRIVGGTVDKGAFEFTPKLDFSNGTVFFLDNASVANNLAVSRTGTDLIFRDIGDPFAPGTDTVSVPLAGISRVVINTGGGDDIARFDLNTTGALAFPQGLFLNQGAGTDTIVFTGNANVGLLDVSPSLRLLRTADGTRIVMTGNERAIVQGGSGNNIIDARGYTGFAVIDGQGGSDVLFAAANNRTILIGGLGIDKLIGGGADDILIGGRTTLDIFSANFAQLVTKWAGGGTYPTRVSQIRAGTGLPAGIKLTTTTVPDDGIKDTITGGGGLDWFWGYPTDLLTDKAATEFLR